MDTERLEHAVALRDSGCVQEALDEFVSLTDSTADPEEKASLLANQVSCYLILGGIAKAEQQLAEARRVAPKTQVLLYLDYGEAMLNWHKGERKQAARILNRLLEHNKELLMTSDHRELYEQVQSGRGMLLTELSRYKEATPLLEESVSFDSRIIEKEGVLRNLGLCYLELGDRERAKGMFEACLREKNHGVYATMAHYYLGTIYFEDAAFAKAQLEFETCLPGAEGARIPAEHVYAYLARTARHLGMKKEAERYEKLAKGRASADPSW